MNYNLWQLQATWCSLDDNSWQLEVNWVNIEDNVWQFEVNWCVNEWQFLTVMGSFGLAADNKRTPVRSLKYNFLQLAATWWSLGDNFWQLWSLEVSLGDSLIQFEVTSEVNEIQFATITGHLGFTGWLFVTIRGQLGEQWWQVWEFEVKLVGHCMSIYNGYWLLWGGCWHFVKTEIQLGESIVDNLLLEKVTVYLTEWQLV